MREKKTRIKISRNLSFSIHGRLKLARLFEMSEEEIKEELEKIEKSPLFSKLKSLGVIVSVKFGNISETSRKFEGMRLGSSSQTPREAMDLNSSLIKTMRRLGEENFKKYFIDDENFSNEDIAAACGISSEEVSEIKDFINLMHVKEEYQSEKAPLPEKYYSCVEAIKMENGTPVTVFFHRDVWKNIYKVDNFKLIQFESSLEGEERKKIEIFLKKVGFIEKRKSALHRLLEFIIEKRKEYLISGNIKDIKIIFQKEASNKLGADESLICRILSNKSVELSWGVEIKIKNLLPNAKKVNKGRVYDLINEYPKLGDSAVSGKMEEFFGVKLSRKSINQYRSEIGK